MGSPIFRLNFQYGAQGHGLVTQTYFPMRDNSKILFSNMWFSYPGTSKNFFHGLVGPDGTLGAFWLILGLKTAILTNFPKKFHVFLVFKICLYFKTIKKLI